MSYIIFSQIMNSNLLDDRYKHDLFIHHYDYNCFQTFYIHHNEIINYKGFYLINFSKMNNSYLQNDFWI